MQNRYLDIPLNIICTGQLVLYYLYFFCYIFILSYFILVNIFLNMSCIKMHQILIGKYFSEFDTFVDQNDFSELSK